MVKVIINIKDTSNAFPENGAGGNTDHPYGTTALAVLALLKAGISPQADSSESQSLRDGMNFLRNKTAWKYTYDIGLMLMAIETYWEKNGGYDKISTEDRQKAMNLAQQLQDMQTEDGYWGYEKDSSHLDLSCTQFAILGLHSATMLEIKVKQKTWERVWGKLSRMQNTDGSWAYQSDAGTSTMTIAGICTTLIVFIQYQRQGLLSPQEAAKMKQSIQKAIEWMQASNHKDPSSSSSWPYYFLYGLERAAGLSKEERLLQNPGVQYIQSHLPSTLVAACFTLLFLSQASLNFPMPPPTDVDKGHLALDIVCNHAENIMVFIDGRYYESVNKKEHGYRIPFPQGKHNLLFIVEGCEPYATEIDTSNAQTLFIDLQERLKPIPWKPSEE